MSYMLYISYSNTGDIEQSGQSQKECEKYPGGMGMKVLLVNGSPHKKGCTWTALNEVAKTLKKEDIETEIFWIGIKPLAGCTACKTCAKTGRCMFDDTVNEFLDIAKDADGFIFGSPVHYAAASGAMTSFMDRVFYTDLQSGRQTFYLETGGRGCFLTPGGDNDRLRPAQQVFHHLGDARHLVPLLEHGPRGTAGRCEKGRRRPADHAHPCTEHGVLPEMQGGGS